MTYYWLSGALVLLGVLLLIVVGLRVFRTMRTFSTMRAAVQGVVQSELGLLKARRAALRVRILGKKAPRAAQES